MARNAGNRQQAIVSRTTPVMFWVLSVACCLLPVFSAGCLTDSTHRAPEWLQRVHSLWTDVRPDAMQMEFAYVRRPLGDPYLTDGLWHELDENCVPLEKRPVLAANGLRVGVVSGTVPTKLQYWLCTDGQSEAHRLVQRSGHASFLPLGPGGFDRTLAIATEDGTQTLQFENIQCGVAVRLGVAENGDTALQLEPCVRHGSRARLPQVAKDGQGLEVTGERPEEQFPALACELTLTPGDYLVLGGVTEKPFTLGYTAFVQPEENQQFILVIRTPRAKPGSPSSDLSNRAAPNSGALPLAIQSAGSAPTPVTPKSG